MASTQLRAEVEAKVRAALVDKKDKERFTTWPLIPSHAEEGVLYGESNDVVGTCFRKLPSDTLKMALCVINGFDINGIIEQQVVWRYNEKGKGGSMKVNAKDFFSYKDVLAWKVDGPQDMTGIIVEGKRHATEAAAALNCASTEAEVGTGDISSSIAGAVDAGLVGPSAIDPDDAPKDASSTGGAPLDTDGQEGSTSSLTGKEEGDDPTTCKCRQQGEEEDGEEGAGEEGTEVDEASSTSSRLDDASEDGEVDGGASSTGSRRDDDASEDGEENDDASITSSRRDEDAREDGEVDNDASITSSRRDEHAREDGKVDNHASSTGIAKDDKEEAGEVDEAFRTGGCNPAGKAPSKHSSPDVGNGVAENKQNTPPPCIRFPPAQPPEKQDRKDDQHEEEVTGKEAASGQGDALLTKGESLELTILG